MGIRQTPDSVWNNELYSNIVITQNLCMMEDALTQMGKRCEFVPYCKKIKEDELK